MNQQYKTYLVDGDHIAPFAQCVEEASGWVSSDGHVYSTQISGLACLVILDDNEAAIVKAHLGGSLIAKRLNNVNRERRVANSDYNELLDRDCVEAVGI